MTPLATVTVSKRPHLWDNVVENILRQSVRPVMCVLISHGDMQVDNPFSLAMKREGISFHTGVVHPLVSAGELTNHAFSKAALIGDALMCTMDDDDYYGENYLASMRDAYLSHPDAWLLGKSAYDTRYVGYKEGTVVHDAGRVIDSLSHAKSLAGPTFCIPSNLWNTHPTLRFPDMGMGCDGEFLQQAARLSGISPAPIYHVEDAEFYLQRYSDPAHSHAWNDPRDHT